MNWVASFSHSLKNRRMEDRLYYSELSKEFEGFCLKLFICASIMLTKLLVDTILGPIFRSSLASSSTSHFSSYSISNDGSGLTVLLIHFWHGSGRCGCWIPLTSSLMAHPPNVRIDYLSLCLLRMSLQLSCSSFLLCNALALLCVSCLVVWSCISKSLPKAMPRHSSNFLIIIVCDR